MAGPKIFPGSPESMWRTVEAFKERILAGEFRYLTIVAVDQDHTVHAMTDGKASLAMELGALEMAKEIAKTARLAPVEF